MNELIAAGAGEVFLPPMKGASAMKEWISVDPRSRAESDLAREALELVASRL